jgi:hypothetical protein
MIIRIKFLCFVMILPIYGAVLQSQSLPGMFAGLTIHADAGGDQTFNSVMLGLGLSVQKRLLPRHGLIADMQHNTFELTHFNGPEGSGKVNSFTLSHSFLIRQWGIVSLLTTNGTGYSVKSENWRYSDMAGGVIETRESVKALIFKSNINFLIHLTPSWLIQLTPFSIATGTYISGPGTFFLNAYSGVSAGLFWCPTAK